MSSGVYERDTQFKRGQELQGRAQWLGSEL